LRNSLSLRLALGAALVCGVFGAIASAPASGAGNPAPARSQSKDWSIKADYIEACSCSLFCSCYFNTKPEGGMMCEFNNAVKITEGHVGDVKVDGLKVWLSGDLGGDFSKGKMKSAILTVEPGTTKQQQEAVMFLLGKIYPVKWAKMNADTSKITWEKNGMNGHAKLANGKGEVTLKGEKGANGQQVVINNLKYWGAQKNTGFYLAKGTHRYKGFGHNYSHKDRNGFFVHIESAGNG
jgi:hypothetical protein